jgi:hypothetical protein
MHHGQGEVVVGRVEHGQIRHPDSAFLHQHRTVRPPFSEVAFSNFGHPLTLPYPLLPPTRRSHVACDVMDVDAHDDARWMSYDELAAARDINRRSAVRLAQRRRWARVIIPCFDSDTSASADG